MDFLTSNIGSARDNSRSPIHNWYKFTAGFSHTFVDELIKADKMKETQAKVFDPFAGCGTTLVSCQKNGITAVGNESQRFMRDVIRAKLDWKISEERINEGLAFLSNFVSVHEKQFDLDSGVHSLLVGLYNRETLKTLTLIRDGIINLQSKKYGLFFNLALSQTLHKVSNHPIAVPYISRNKILKGSKQAWVTFENISRKMLEDTSDFRKLPGSSKVYLHDSRIPNRYIEEHTFSNCVTSPPYLNNLDYGEVSKVHTHFFNITNSWGDITLKVRRNLVTGSTTHYRESEFNIENYKDSNFFIDNKLVGEQLLETAIRIREIGKSRAGHKSFDILALLYFQDMFDVLREIRRVVKPGGKSYLILGDSAPYGVFVPTTKILGKIAKGAGFDKFEIHKIRSRGLKWKTLTHRHSQELDENVLILK